jgi:hypothetical protein
MAPGGDGLPVAVSDAAANGIGDACGCVADLVQSAGVVESGAVVDALAVDVERAAPFAVVVALEAEVEPGAQVESSVGEHFDLKGPGSAVIHGAMDLAAAEPALGRLIGEFRSDVDRRQIL